MKAGSNFGNCCCAIATGTLGVHKPEPDAFLKAAELMGLPPAEILFIDDKLENVVAARAVGMQASVIDLKGQQPGVLHDLTGVMDLL